MEHIRNDKFERRDTCVAFGDFDGIHKGHMALVAKLCETAEAKGLASVVVSFDRDAIGNDRILTSEEEKCYLLDKEPVECVISMAPRPIDEAFAKEVLAEKLGAVAIVVGSNHGSLELLRACGGKYGFDVVECAVVEEEGEPIDAGRVKTALQNGDLETVAALMGHPHMVLGRVVPGKQLGRTIGQPTANIDFVQNKLLPPDGSYVTMTTVDGERKVGLTNIGKRPTVDSFDYRTVENFILDFSGDLYGKVLPLEIYRFIRGVYKFNNLEEVRVQCAKDVQAIRDYIDSMK